MALWELTRRGKLPQTTKDDSDEAQDTAKQLGVFGLTNEALAMIAGVEPATVKRQFPKGKKGPKSKSNFDKSNPLELSPQQLEVRSWIRDQTHYGNGKGEIVLFKSGAKKGQVNEAKSTPAFDFETFATFMDEAGIPRQVRDTSTTDRPTRKRGTKQHVTVGDESLTVAFAEKHGLG